MVKSVEEAFSTPHADNSKKSKAGKIILTAAQLTISAFAFFILFMIKQNGWTAIFSAIITTITEIVATI